MKYLGLLVLSFIVLIHSQAQPLQVPADYSTIQAAIDASTPGDSIHIAVGTYAENLTITHQLTIYSDFLISQDEQSISQTIIDGSAAASVIHCVNPNGNALELIGLTIQNGGGTEHPYYLLPDTTMLYGSGMYFAGIEDVRLNHLIVKDNSFATDNNSGGGLFAEMSGLDISHCLFESNEVFGQSFLGEGAAMCFYNCSVMMHDSQISENTGHGGYALGAGVYAVNSNMVFENTDFIDNVGSGSVMGWVGNSNLQMTSCEVSGNVASFTNVLTAQAGNSSSNLITLNDCLFAENEGNQFGTFHFIGSILTISNSEFTANSAAFDAPCLSASSCILDVSTTTFSENFCAGGSSLSCDAGAMELQGCQGVISQTLMKDNTIVSASSNGKGGALEMSSSVITLDSLIIKDNIGVSGGGVYAVNSHINMLETAICDNESERGGGIMSTSSVWEIINCTIAGNSAPAGNALWLDDDQGLILNSILWNENGEEIFCNTSSFSDTSHYDIAYSTVQGLDDEIENPDWIDITWQAGNIELAPHFQNVSDGDYRLLANSAQIDAGIDFFQVDTVVVLDTDDYLDSAPDMGYHETSVTSLQEEGGQRLVLFPNPVTHTLFVQGVGRAMQRIHIFDMSGRLLLSELLLHGQVDVSSLSAGVYVIELTGAEGQVSQHFIKE